MALEDLYREVILDHYRNPRNREPLAHPDRVAQGVNPLCGDEVTVELALDDGTVAGVSVHGQGCSISQSSGSMMSAAIKGKTRHEIEELIHGFKELMDIEGADDAAPLSSDLGELEALRGVRRYPVRIKCANLPWTTLAEALENAG